jgi:hypothetical protein
VITERLCLITALSLTMALRHALSATAPRRAGSASGRRRHQDSNETLTPDEQGAQARRRAYSTPGQHHDAPAPATTAPQRIRDQLDDDNPPRSASSTPALRRASSTTAPSAQPPELRGRPLASLPPRMKTERLGRLRTTGGSLETRKVQRRRLVAHRAWTTVDITHSALGAE